jgi:UDP-N-acetylmuramoyl-L-alanyl-D-glutamate--2,6-diaminopimelate ligase
MSGLKNKIIGKYKNTRHYVNSLIEVAKAGYPTKKLHVIGITGTDGKTTTSHLVYEILKKAGMKVALVSTIGAWIGEEFQDTGFHITTPDAKVLQPFFKKLTEEGIEYVVLEATSHGLDQHRTLGANFEVGVLTNVTHEHLDYHKTFERYRNAKSKLFRGVKVGVINKDDNSFEFFKKTTPRGARTISYAIDKPADLRGINIQERPSGLHFQIAEDAVAHEIKTTLPGKYNAANILGAAGAARALGINWETIQTAIKDFRGIPGRMEIIKSKPYTVIVDFAHTPNALENLLLTLKNKLPKNGRLITVFGCAGERDRLKRPLMGAVSARLANISIFTAEDPRSESLDVIVGKMAEGASGEKAVERTANQIKLSEKKHVFIKEPDRKEAISLAVKIARNGDVIAICGKGHEKSLAIGGTEHPWSDQETARSAILEVGKKRR